VNTRRYHATVQYASAVQPRGFNLLEEFWLDPFPVWRYQLAFAAIEKTVCLPDTQQAVLVRYLTTHACRFTVRLFLLFRDYHSLTQRNSAVKNEIKEGQTRIILAPYEDLPALTVFHGAGAFTRDGIWFLNHEYLRELDRGLDFREDLFSPEFIAFELSPEQPAWFIATLEPDRFPALLAHQDIELILAEEASRKYFNAPTPLESTLNRVLDQFRVVRSKGLPSLIAGFPWFTDWSRDTLISLPALSIAGFPADEIKRFSRCSCASARTAWCRIASPATIPRPNTTPPMQLCGSLLLRVITLSERRIGKFARRLVPGCLGYLGLASVRHRL
jgi:predicted glycogen debranching enzyme